MNKTEFAKRYCLDSVVKPTAKKKRYEVHYQAQDPKGNVFLLVKEAVCTPGELRGILKKFESEQKAKGNKILSELYRKSFAVDSADVLDGYTLGRSIPDVDENAPLKVLSVSTKKEPDGISGTVKMSKGKKTVSNRFMVYNSGNWDMKPIDFLGFKITASERAAVMDAVRKKLLPLGVKAK